jgi:putative MATE family efflux protein
MWLAVGSGVVGGALLALGARPVLTLLGGDGAVLDAALTYLRISVLGLPAMLLSLAAVGYLRGLQDTLRPFLVAVITAGGNLLLEIVLVFGFGLGIGASALSTVVAQWAGAAMYLRWVGRAVRVHGAPLRPEARGLRAQAAVAGDLFLRTAALRLSFTVAVAVAARLGTVEVGAHEIVFQIFLFVALALDAVAIAGQAIIGRVLGAGDTLGARRVGNRMVRWGVATGALATVGLLAARPWLPDLFSDDPAVISLVGFLLIHLALMQPLNGVVFALDGILIGAGDMRFLAWAMAGAAALFVPLTLAIPALGLGIGWLWGTLWVLMIVRAVSLLARFRSEAWMVTGAVAR